MINRTEAFKRDCRIVNMKMEYPGYTGEIMWMVVSDLTEEEIIATYPVEIQPYMPFVYMTREMFAPIVESDNNERTYRRRSVLHEDLYGYEDGIFERFHPNLVSDPFDHPDWTELYKAIAKLSTIQQSRIRRWAFEGMSFVEIAEQDGTTKQAIHDSIHYTLKKLKKFLQTP
jgi:hypothetical protein